MMRVCAAALLLALASCAAQVSEPETYAEAAAGEAPPPETLSGDWDMLLLDGDKQKTGLRFSADGTSIWWNPPCAAQRRNYSIEDDRIQVSPGFTPGERVGACRIGLPPRLPEFLAALDAANTVESAPAGTIRIHGQGHVILLVPVKK